MAIITKNQLVTRDIDHLRELARFNAARVFVSVTTLDPKLASIMEPRTSTPELRLGAVEALAAAGIPAGVMVAPVVPAITEHEMPAILTAAKEAGARWAGMVVLRLPWAVAVGRARSRRRNRRRTDAGPVRGHLPEARSERGRGRVVDGFISARYQATRSVRLTTSP